MQSVRILNYKVNLNTVRVCLHRRKTVKTGQAKLQKQKSRLHRHLVLQGKRRLVVNRS
jgi:hypothetical protein